MFTGLVEEVGRIAAIEPLVSGSRLVIEAATVTSDVSAGDSIAVSGVCLTALDVTASSFAADVSPETLKRSNLGSLKIGSRVNLERSLTPSARMGGHIVQGHVDGRGTFLGAVASGDFWAVTIGFDEQIGRYFVEKGSVAVNGISLTIAALRDDSFDIAVIPNTWDGTDLSSLSVGDSVNLEVDVIAKYVERLLAFKS